MGTASTESAVLHVLVVGFHHKKGCQIEYAHPPLMDPANGDPRSPEVPSQWKHLPSLAMPDGSHNFEEDTAFFHLPDLNNPRKTVFGISCYRQIPVEKVVNRTEDITRGTVQKSVCVLSRLPLYGQIQVKMSLITEAYFREGDFTRLDLIHQTYDNLNACLSDDMLYTQQLYVGLSARDFVRQFKQRALMLFKLMLLERKVLFFQSPVQNLCSFLLTLLSLHPGMLEKGLDEAARMVPADTPPSTSPEVPEESVELEQPDRPESAASSITDSVAEKAGGIKERLSGAFGYLTGYKQSQSSHSISSQQGSLAAEEGVEEAVIPAPNFASVTAVPYTSFGLPLNIFTGGNLCQPYLSLSYLDILTQPSVHGYLIGATNILFKQKKGVAEVVVDIPQDKYEIHDPELRRALQLTTEDLRFMDNVVKHVAEDKNSDVFLDGVGWEGGDEWVRAQFRFYLVCLLRTSLLDEDMRDGLFNSSFMNLWRRTKNYRHWRDQLQSSKEIRDTIDGLIPGHPFSGHLSVTDMRLHLSNTIYNTEGGKKVSQVVSNTSKAVAGGLNSAKGAFSSFLTSLRQPSVSPRSASPEVDEAKEAKEETETDPTPSS